MDNLLIYGTFFGLVMLTLIVGYLANRLMSKIISGSTTIIKNDPTYYKFLRHVLLALVYIVGFSIAIYSVPQLRTLAGSMLAGAGILAVAIGFASQQALSNIISGVFIIIFKPFKINDRLSIKTFEGVVEDITLRHTVIRSYENKRIVIPNSLISEEVIVNADLGDQRICRWIDFGIGYESDLDLAKQIMVEEITTHPLRVDIRTEEDIANGVPNAVVRVIEIGDSAILIRGWAWAADQASSFELKCDLLEFIKRRFDKEGIDIPYPHRTILMKQQAPDKHSQE